MIVLSQGIGIGKAGRLGDVVSEAGLARLLYGGVDEHDPFFQMWSDQLFLPHAKLSVDATLFSFL